MKMEERFFFHRVGSGGTDFVIIERIQSAVDGLADPAVPQSAIRNQAPPIAQTAADLLVLFVPENRPLS
jgi:hypothetical protein